MVACCPQVRHRDLVILVSTSFVRLSISGLWFTPGILYVAFRDEFLYSAGVTSWITALQYFTSCVTSAVGGLLVRRFGSRLVTMAGGLVMASGMLTSMLATHIAHVFLTFGVLSGFGCGLSYIGSLEALNVELTTYRNILFGICGFAANMGIVIYPPVLQGLINTYTWRGMFLVLGASQLNIIAIAILYPGRKNQKKDAKIPDTKPYQDTELSSERDGQALTLLPGDSDKQKKILNSTSNKIPSGPKDQTMLCRDFENSNADIEIELALLPADCDLGETSSGEKIIFNNPSNKISTSLKDRSVLGRNSGKGDKDIENEILSQNTNDEDIFDDHNSSKTKSFLNRKPFLKNRHYYLYLVSGTFQMFGCGIILGHLSAFAILNDLTDRTGAPTLYTVNAVSLAVTKLLQGFAMSNKRLQPVTLHIIIAGIGGLMSLVFLGHVPLPVLYLYTVVFGASNSCMGGALLPAVIVDMSGAVDFSFALGLCVLITALGSLTGAPIAGWIYDVTQSYTVPFLVASIAMMSSSVVMILSYYLKKVNSTSR